MKSRFFQVEVDENSRKYTAFVCKNGLYQFKRMPFGLTNNPSTFCRIVQHVLQGLNWKVCINYLDDIIIFSTTLEEHLQNLQMVFNRLRQFNLKLTPTKCNFLQITVAFLGHTISSEGISPNNKKIEIIQNHPTPKTKKQLKSFLGLANYYRKYIPGVAKIMEPLNKLLRKNVKFEWCEQCESSFEILKEKLTSYPILAFRILA